MKTFESIADARSALMDFRAEQWTAVPEFLRPRFKELSASPSPVDQIVGVGEFVFANREKLTAPAWELGAGLISYATINAWHGLLDNNRGNAIVANLRKLMGEIQSAPAAPEPRLNYKISDPADAPADAPADDTEAPAE